MIGDRHDRVVKCRENVRDAGVNILASFGFDDLWLLNRHRRRSERFSGGGAADVTSAFLVLAGFFAGLASASALAGVDSAASRGELANCRFRHRLCNLAFRAFVGFFGFDVSALDLVVFSNSAIRAHV